MSSTIQAGFRTAQPKSFPASSRLLLALCLTSFFGQISVPYPAFGQTAAPASANVTQLGTVKSVAGNVLTLTPDKGADLSITALPATRILKIAPGAKDLKAAQPLTLADIAPGDRVLATSKPGDGGVLNALRLIVTKASDIAAKHAEEAADWQRRGSGGIVTAINGSTLTISARDKKTEIVTSPTTIFRRYAPGSVKFEDAQIGTLAQIHPGDQLRVRGDKSSDGGSIAADEIVSGSFLNLSGILSAVDAAGGSLTLKDIATKKTVKVLLTSDSQIKTLPAGGQFGRGAGQGAGSGGGQAAAAGGQRQWSGGGAGGGRSGGDLSQMVARLPAVSAETLKPGQAVMIVASSGVAATDAPTAITVLSGVEQILAATPTGQAPMTLSPMVLGMPGGEGPE